MADPAQIWADVVTAQRGAQAARDMLRRRDVPQTERDRATVSYGYALDGLFAAMERLLAAADSGQIAVSVVEADPTSRAAFLQAFWVDYCRPEQPTMIDCYRRAVRNAQDCGLPVASMAEARAYLRGRLCTTAPAPGLERV